jgi:hypothetical protein
MAKKKRKAKDNNGPAGLVIILDPLDRSNLRLIQVKGELVGSYKKVAEIASDAVKIGIKELLK